MSDTPSPQTVGGQQLVWESGDLSPLAQLSPFHSGSAAAPIALDSRPMSGVPGGGLSGADMKLLMQLSPASTHAQAGAKAAPITPQLLNDITPSGSQLELHPGWSLGFWDVTGSGDAMQHALHTSASILGQSGSNPPDGHPLLRQSRSQDSTGSAALKWGGLSPAAQSARDFFSASPTQVSAQLLDSHVSLGLSPLLSLQSDDGQGAAALNGEASARYTFPDASTAPSRKRTRTPTNLSLASASSGSLSLPQQQALQLQALQQQQYHHLQQLHSQSVTSSQGSFGALMPGAGLDVSASSASAASATMPPPPPAASAPKAPPGAKPAAKGAAARPKGLTKSQEDCIVDRMIASADGATSTGERVCKCRKSRCLKLYCECFAAGLYCHKDCKCNDCCNNQKYQALRAQAIRAALARNPEAFNNKFEANGRAQSSGQHRTGCRCKRSACLKKYCE